MPDFDLSITICSWNTQTDLRACLQSLRECRDEAHFEVVVVDNASHDGSPDMVAAEFPEFRLLRQSVNLGFTGGHNLALRERRGHHAALLNSDTVVHPGAIRALMAYWEQHPEAGILGPKLLNPDGSLQYSCRRFPNPVAAAFRNTVLGRLFPHHGSVRDYLMQDWDHNDIRTVDWVSGAALFIRAEVIEKIGVLDDTFFMYCEDVDLCKRTWDAGYEVVYLPESVITHAIGTSSSQVADKMIVRFHRSMFRYYGKHIASRNVLVRPVSLAFAGTMLALRASLFLGENRIDALRRRLGR